MKRVTLFLLVVIGLVAMTHQALVAEPVTSVNVVGFKKTVVPADGKFVMVGMNFDAFDPTLLGVFGTNQLRKGKNAGSGRADKIYIWHPDWGTSGQFEVFAQNTNNNFYLTVGWPNTQSNAPLHRGEGFWVSSPKAVDGGTNDLELTLAGEAVDDANITNNIVRGFQMISYPFSADIDIQQTDFANDGANKGKAAGSGNADKISLWDASIQQFKIYGLNSNKLWHPTVGWPGQPVSNVVIHMGEGFWYQSMSNGFAWTETNKYLSNLRAP